MSVLSAYLKTCDSKQEYRFTVARAYFNWLCTHHMGQWSDEYRFLSILNRTYSPGLNEALSFETDPPAGFTPPAHHNPERQIFNHYCNRNLCDHPMLETL